MGIWSKYRNQNGILHNFIYFRKMFLLTYVYRTFINKLF